MTAHGENSSEGATLTGALALLEASTELDPAGSKIAAKRVILADLILDHVDGERVQRGDLEPIDRTPVLLACLLADIGHTVLRRPASGAAAAAAALLRSVPALAPAAAAVAARYEHVDGGGLPEGLSGQRIPFGARLLALVDLLASQPATPQVGWHRRLEMMKDAAGTTLDLELVESAYDVLQAMDVRQRVDRCGPADAITILASSQQAHTWTQLATVVEADSNVLSAAQVLTEAALERGAPYAAAGVQRFTGDGVETVALAGDQASAWEPADPEAVAELRSLSSPRVLALENNSVTVVPVRCVEPWGFAWAVHGSVTDADARPLQGLATALETIVARRGHVNHLDELAHRDELTALANRRALDVELARLFDAPQTARIDAALIMCDVDGLKRVNDTRGHSAGDDVLRAVATVLVDLISHHDGFAARLGGDEFCMVLRSGGLLHAQSLARRAAADVRSLGHPRVGLSCGVALAAQTDTASELLGRADEALYVVKRRQPAPADDRSVATDRRRRPDR